MEKLTQIKLIVADLDGTLLDEKKEIDRDIYSLIPIMKERGISFSLGSGRNMHIMQDFVSQLQLDVPYITNNGANMFQGNHCIYECRIATSDLLLALTLLEQAEIPFLVYSNHAVYPFKAHPELSLFMERLQGKSDIVKITKISDIIGCSVFKVVMIDENTSRMTNLMEQINRQCEKAHCVRSEGNVYTLTHIDATKGNTLKKLLSYLNIDPKEVLVFGDNYNDISMFQVAGYSVAMGNSMKEIQTKATFVTKSNEEHGVSWFIRKFMIE